MARSASTWVLAGRSMPIAALSSLVRIALKFAAASIYAWRLMVRLRSGPRSRFCICQVLFHLRGVIRANIADSVLGLSGVRIGTFLGVKFDRVLNVPGAESGHFAK